MLKSGRLRFRILDALDLPMSKRCYRHAEKGVGVVEMIDFDVCERVRGRGYRDNAGRKLPCLYDGGLWMVKFQGSTRNMAGAHLPS